MSKKVVEFSLNLELKVSNQNLALWFQIRIKLLEDLVNSPKEPNLKVEKKSKSVIYKKTKQIKKANLKAKNQNKFKKAQK